MKDINAWTAYTKKQEKEIETLSAGYRKFLNDGKTERECIKQIKAMAEAAGYRPLNELVEEGKKSYYMYITN